MVHAPTELVAEESAACGKGVREADTKEESAAAALAARVQWAAMPLVVAARAGLTAVDLACGLWRWRCRPCEPIGTVDSWQVGTVGL